MSIFLLVPLTGWLLSSVGSPDVLTQLVVLAELFGLPVVAAIFGIDFAARSMIRAD